MNPLNLFALFTLVLCIPSSATAYQQDSNRASELVRALSSADEDTRIKSEQALLEIGPAAIKDLEAGSRSVNIEISSRCQRILVRINKKVNERKRKAFLADPTTFDNPTWKTFTSLFENDSVEIRELFLDVCYSHSDHFENWNLKGLDEDSAAAAVRLARVSSSMLDANHYRDINVLAGFLFADSIAQQKLNKFKDAAKVIAFQKQRHLNSLKALNYLAENDRISAARHRDYSKSFDLLATKWFRSIETYDSPSAEQSKMKLVYESLNELLIEQLSDSYETLDNEQKLKFLDIVRHYSKSERELRKKIDHAKVFRWMSPALEDPSVLLTTRLREKPSTELKVTARQFALAIACPMVAASKKDASKMLDLAFGSLPLSSESIEILKGKASEAEVLEKITKARKPDGS